MLFSSLAEVEAKLQTPADILAGFLHDVKVLRNGWATARCPLHEDSNSSFSVNLSSGNWKCFACDKTGGLFELPGCPTEPLPVKVYPYYAGDVLAYIKVRFFPKTFRLYSHRLDGVLIPGMCGQPHQLYNWEQVKGKEGDVYLVEGEKDCDTLTGLGLLAVTNGSASSWDKRFAAQLEGRKVILIPDNDQAGRAWMHSILDDIHPFNVLEIPDPDIRDVSAWIEQGHSISALRPNKQNRTSAVAEIIDLSQHSAEPKKPEIWGSIIPFKHTTLLYGDGGQGKSLFCLMLAYHLATGRKFLGVPTMRVNTLYLDWELDTNEHHRRATQIAKGLGDEALPSGLYYYRANADLCQILPQIKEAVTKYDISLIIIDSCGPAAPGDLNSSETIIRMFAELEKLNCTVLMIDHEAKQLGDSMAVKPYGSVYKYNLSRSVLKIVKSEELAHGGVFKVMQFKNNFGKLADPLKYKLDFSGEAIVVGDV